MSISLSRNGCGCCAWQHDCDLTERVLMPDGIEVWRLVDSRTGESFWYDPRLEDHYEGWDD